MGKSQVDIEKILSISGKTLLIFHFLRDTIIPLSEEVRFVDYDLMRERLVEAREHIGLNRKEFASKLNIPYRTITNYENGAREAGSDYLTKVATTCGVTTDWILGVSDKRNPPRMVDSALGELSSQLEILASALEKLNDEGQEKLLDYADDLVSSGKYIKSDPYELGEPQKA